MNANGPWHFVSVPGSQDLPKGKLQTYTVSQIQFGELLTT